jgi:hypothetical protein
VSGRSDGDGRDAGPFAPWLVATLAVLRDRADADVPCDGCTACCESSQFVLVEPDEHDTRAHIPAELLFPAPGAPKGFSLLPYDEHGRCPMLVDGACSIYEHRPRTCRAYDCRVLAAAGVDPGPDKPAIRHRVAEWRFTYDDEGAARRAAVRSAADFVGAHADHLPGGSLPPTQRASAAVEVHHLFGAGSAADTAEVLVELRRLRPR